ncbi:MAG: acylneuraminate cytidylyltransferase family protein [Candidatus Binatia bacterium]|nr:acylneuraminate cytidylyltransferase family protein [Candidatus Binatia bacterium]
MVEFSNRYLSRLVARHALDAIASVTYKQQAYKMINGKTVLAVIPARGGSKRVPGKNLREYRGKSLLLLVYESMRGSKYIDALVVSTDDDEIRRATEQIGTVIVRNRPAELATDEASSEDVLRDVLALFPAYWVVLLQPTSPLRTAEDIDACIERAQMGDGCISYSNGTWRPNGAVYVAKAEWIAKHDFSHAGLMKYIMPEERSLDINEPEDFDK